MNLSILHDAVGCRLLSNASVRVLVVLYLNDPMNIRSLRVVRELSGVARPGRCLRELNDAGLIKVERYGFKGNRLKMSRMPEADFHSWCMMHGVDLEDKSAPLLRSVPA